MIKQLHDITCVFQGLQGVGAIYISGITGAKNLSILQRHNIKAVVCAARSGFIQYQKSIVEDYLYIPADDYEQFDLSQFFQKAYQFIEKNRKKTNVLVHCMAGISRSATLVVAYLMKKYGYSMNSILNLLKRKRSIINPNEGFLKQLKSFQTHSDSKDQKSQVKKIDYQDRKRQNFLSARKDNKKYDSKSIVNNPKRNLSKESKQFLQTLKKKSNISTASFHKRQSSLIDELISNPSKQNHPHLHFNKQDFYSSELDHIINFVHIQHQVSQLQNKLQKQKQKQNLQSTISSIRTNEDNEKQNVFVTQRKPPLSQRLQIMKANLIRQYKLNKHKNKFVQTRQENQEQKQIDLALAIKIFKSKPKKYTDKRISGLVDKC